MRKILPLLLILVLCGCSTVAGVAQSMSSSSPTQVTTLSDAVAAATLMTRAVDAYVATGHPSKPVLVELQTLNEGLHTSLIGLEKADAAHQSLAIAAFNEALSAFESYSAARGVKH